jgi:hypothetical protein
MSDDTKCLDFMEGSQEIILVEDGNAIVRHEWTISLEDFKGKIASLNQVSDSLAITDERSLETALDFSSEVLKVREKIETIRKELTKPHRQVVQNINDFAKRLTDSLDHIKSTLTLKLSQWHLKQEQAALKAKEEAKAISETLGINLDIIAPDAKKSLSSSKASTAMRESVTFEVIDQDAVPDEYWVIDEKLIQKHIDAGKREIPGIRVFIEKNLIIRRKS